MNYSSMKSLIILDPHFLIKFIKNLFLPVIINQTTFQCANTVKVHELTYFDQNNQQFCDIYFAGSPHGCKIKWNKIRIAERAEN